MPAGVGGVSAADDAFHRHELRRCRGLSRLDSPGRRRWLLAAGIVANVLLLGYLNLKISSCRVFRPFRLGLRFAPELPLPLAISFYTFTQTAYLVDIYRDPKNRRGFLDYCLFIMFFCTSWQD